MYYICSWEVPWNRSTVNEAQPENRPLTAIFDLEINGWLGLLAKTITLTNNIRTRAGGDMASFLPNVSMPPLPPIPHAQTRFLLR